MKYGKLFFWVVLLLLVVIAKSSYGQEGVKELEQVIVTATKTEEEPRHITVPVTVITNKNMESRKQREVYKAIRNVPGVRVAATGGEGKVTDIFIRGSDSDHVLVLIDGVQMNNPNTGGVIYEYLLTDNVERVEVVRGAMSPLHGSDALGGVINIITSKGEGKPRYRFRQEVGSFETFKEAAIVSGGFQNGGYSFSFTRIDSDGEERNEDYSNMVFSGRVDIQMTDIVDLVFTGRFMDAETGSPGERNFTFDPNDRNEMETALFSVQYKHLITDWLEQKVFFSVVDDDSKFLSPAPNGFGSAQTSTTTSQIDTQRTNLDFQTNIYTEDFSILTLGFEWEQQEGTNNSIDPDYIASGTFFIEKKVVNLSWYAQEQFRLWDRLFVTSAVRIDDHSSFGTEVNPKVSCAYDFKETGSTFKGSWATAFRAPTVNELVYPNFGSEGIKAEDVNSFEFGIEQRLFEDMLVLEGTYFENDFGNLIQYTITSLSPFVAQVENVGSARTKGFETQAVFRPLEDLLVSSMYTYLETEDLSTGKDLRRRPRHIVGFNLDYSFLEGWNLSVDCSFVGKFFDDDFATSYGGNGEGYVDGYNLVNFACSYDLNENLQFSGKIENLLDDNYEEARGYPAYPITFMTGVKLIY